MLKLVLSLILLETYFVVNYFLTNYINDNMSALVKEMNVTSQALPYYTYAFNVLR